MNFEQEFKNLLDRLEILHHSVNTAAEEKASNEYEKGLKLGLLMANRHYQRIIQEFKSQLTEEYMQDDIDFYGGEESA